MKSSIINKTLEEGAKKTIELLIIGLITGIFTGTFLVTLVGVVGSTLIIRVLAFELIEKRYKSKNE